jgi:hypothetical protein
MEVAMKIQIKTVYATNKQGQKILSFTTYKVIEEDEEGDENRIQADKSN